METITEHEFWKSIMILLKNYHAINKKIFSTKFVTVKKISKGIEKVCKTFENKFGSYNEDESVQLTAECESEEAIIDSITAKEFLSGINEGFIFWMHFSLKKKNAELINAIGLINFTTKSYYCTFQKDLINFSVHLCGGKLIVEPRPVQNIQEIEKASNWCKFVLSPKLFKWAVNPNYEDTNKLAINSLQLINSEHYIELYNEFKNKYSKPLLEIWSAECTDPLKFIYEDLAIAAYLVSLWKEKKIEPKGFADLGCGNGLLVYVLSEEGYNGYGYDVRKRKIWSLYPTETTFLIEKSINPDDFQVPEDVDWIIGNHSDELSPWIPVIAALSSYEIKYFLLPCCAFEFTGVKYQRRNSKMSTYNNFLEYVEHISQQCGFETLTDRLKIPSTKRIALVGLSRKYEKNEHEIKKLDLQKFVENEIKGFSIKIREKEEIVRNCTQIDKTILDKLILKIFQVLLTSNEVSTQAIDNFDMGKKLTIKEIVNRLAPEDLKNIKAECGGIKTLLKNHHAIFKINRDEVQLRRPVPNDSSSKKPITIKKRLCFFNLHHPNGCLLADKDCTFIH